MFLSELNIAAAHEPDYWYVRSPLVWDDARYGRIVVPNGFRTDLASIPRIFRNLPTFDPNGQSRRPAVAHDFLYVERRRGKDFADHFLQDALRAEGMHDADALTFYEAVHVFGESSWQSDSLGLSAATFDTYANYAAYLSSLSAPMAPPHG